MPENMYFEIIIALGLVILGLVVDDLRRRSDLSNLKRAYADKEKECEDYHRRYSQLADQDKERLKTVLFHDLTFLDEDISKPFGMHDITPICTRCFPKKVYLSHGPGVGDSAPPHLKAINPEKTVCSHFFCRICGLQVPLVGESKSELQESLDRWYRRQKL